MEDICYGSYFAAETTMTATTPAKSITDLPEATLRHILRFATDRDDLLRHVSTCAGVCREWRRIAGNSRAYGAPHQCPGWVGEEGHSERARVLRAISDALRYARANDDVLTLDQKEVGDDGARALGAALQAMRAPLPISELRLAMNNLTAVVAPIAATGLRRGFAGRGLTCLSVNHNRGLGNAGIMILADAFPSELEHLNVSCIAMGDEGMVALAANMPRTLGLQRLVCHSNPAVGPAGWSALATVLPNLVALQELNAGASTGMGDAGAAALALGLPGATSLWHLQLGNCNIGNPGARALVSLLPVLLCFQRAFRSRGDGDKDAVAAQGAVLGACESIQELILSENLYDADSQVRPCLAFAQSGLQDHRNFAGYKLLGNVLPFSHVGFVQAVLDAGWMRRPSAVGSAQQHPVEHPYMEMGDSSEDEDDADDGDELSEDDSGSATATSTCSSEEEEEEEEEEDFREQLQLGEGEAADMSWESLLN